ncbi:MAG: hypothetical protein U0869_22720 [Chloroflexota bacterium]
MNADRAARPVPVQPLAPLDGDLCRAADTERADIAEDFLLRGMCSRDQAEAEAARLLPERVPSPHPRPA